MHKYLKKILSKIEQNGYEAYIVGGYVRDFYLHKKSFDIDICTNAVPEELMHLFPYAKSNNIGGIYFQKNKYNFEITTYRKELKYENRHPIKIKYIDSLREDLKRRDFTINAIVMNKKGEILDYLNGIEDINNKEIKMIGDINSKIIEDPLRILRAIRFATILNFKLTEELSQSILENNKLILTLSNTRIKEELDKILSSDNVLYGLNLLTKLGISSLFELEYNNIIPLNCLTGMYAQIKIGYELPYTKEEKKNIKILQTIIKDGKINSYTIYKYGLELSSIAGAILNINPKEIKKIYRKLPIHKRQDIKISGEEIIEVLGISYKKNINNILNELENLIISSKIKNSKKNIMHYIKTNKNW